jgi:phosphotransferase system HPr (HPr) family protein
MKVSKTIVVTDPVGFHLRAAAQFIMMVNKFKCKIWIRKGIEQINGRSILCILQLAAVFGTQLDFILDGDDALDALEAVQNFFSSTLS